MPAAVKTKYATSSPGIGRPIGRSDPGAREPAPGSGPSPDSEGIGLVGGASDGLGDGERCVGLGMPLREGSAVGSSLGDGLGVAVGPAGCGVPGGVGMVGAGVG